MKKLLLLLLCLASTLVASAQSGYCGKNLTWTLKDSVLTISGTGAMASYSFMSDIPWYSSINKISKVIIDEGVTSIGNGAFSRCSNLTSVTIPNSVTRIGEWAFNECSKLTSVNISDLASWCNIDFDEGHYANPTTYAHKLVLNGTEIKDLVIPDGTKEIKRYAFRDCSSLTSVTIPNSVTCIRSGAFGGCSGLTSVNISDLASWCNMDFDYDYTNPLSDAHKLVLNGTEIKDLVIPDGVTEIKKSVFYCCSSLTSVTIPNSVTRIGSNAFSGCYGLTSVNISDLASWCNIYFGSKGANPACHAHKLVLNGTEIKDLVIPDGNEEINNYAFYNCSDLTSVTIPNSVMSIGEYAFSYCSGLTSITIPNSVTSIGGFAFEGCSGLTSVNIPNSVTSIGIRGFAYCSGLTSITIPNSVRRIRALAFWGCSGLTSITIPNSVRNIESSAFNECLRLNSLKLEGMDTEMEVSPDYDFNIYVYTPSSAHLNLLSQKYKNLYNIETGLKTEEAPESYFSSVSGGYTGARANFVNLMSGYDWFTRLGSKATLTPVVDNSCTHMAEKAGTHTIYLYAKYKYMDSGYYLMDQKDVTTKDIESFIQNYKVTGSSITPDNSIAEELEQEGAADVRCSYMISDDAPMTGLDPNTEYIVCRNIHCDAFDKTFYDNVKTAPISFTTAPAKVINMGNVIVSATTNVDEEEINVGFEWRRQDWSSLNPSNTASAPIYDGQMEGYIRNIYAEAQWKYRPYYQSNSGKYYYGEWMGFDPTNTSYFEPTVHTYDKIEVAGNTAVVKGYAMRGTDDVLSQGFRYWISANASNTSMKAPSMNDIMTIESKGQVMTAVLPDLQYETTYCYQAYVTTAEGTTEGEIRMFTTGEDPSDISPIQISDTDTEKKIIGYFDLNGRVLSSPTRGISIVRYSDGSSRCVVTR